MRWNIGEFEFDGLTGWLYGPTNTRLNEKDIAVLRYLIENFGKKITKRKLIAEVWGTPGGGDHNLHQSVHRLRVAFGVEHPDEYIASYPYRLLKHPFQLPSMEFTEDIASIHTNSATLRSGPPDKPSNRKFILSVDGIVLNSVGELIFERLRGSTIAECRTSYERALEDFAFALVYGSELRAKWERRAPFMLPKDKELEPAELLISELPPEAYNAEILNPAFHSDRIFENEHHKECIRNYIRCMKLRMRNATFVGWCRDWLRRESERYLGDDPSLFKRVKHPTERHFGKEYYRYDLVEDIPKLLGHSELATLVNFVARGPSPGGAKTEPYVHEARVQFVIENVLTHIATMYQFEKHAEDSGLWRVPYGLRAEVTRQASNSHAQRRLRSILIGHALKFALDNISVCESRMALIEMLSAMRSMPSFVEIREMLGHLNVILREPDPDSEKKASRFIHEISKAGREMPYCTTDDFWLAHSSVLRDIHDTGPDNHRSRFYELFRELQPASVRAQRAFHRSQSMKSMKMNISRGDMLAA